MGAIAVLSEGRVLPSLSASGRSLRDPLQFHRCRSALDLLRLLQTRLTEAILLDAKRAAELDLQSLRAHYPGIPVIIMARLRGEDAGVLLRFEELGVALVLVEGIDDAVAGDLLVRQTVSHRRRAALGEFPRLLRLTERLQLLAWERLGENAARPPGTADLARSLEVSREHLSRQFAAGGAPTLKQVADLLRVITALSLLQNPGYDTPAVVRLLERFRAAQVDVCHVVLTCDNPRTEDPLRIINDVVVGLQKANANYVIEQDRDIVRRLRETGLPVIWQTAAPEGTLDYVSPDSYEMAEALRVLNIVLQSRGVMLLKSEAFGLAYDAFQRAVSLNSQNVEALNLTAGCSFMFGNRASLAGGYVAPIGGDQQLDGGLRVQLDYYPSGRY